MRYRRFRQLLLIPATYTSAHKAFHQEKRVRGINAKSKRLQNHLKFQIVTNFNTNENKTNREHSKEHLHTMYQPFTPAQHQHQRKNVFKHS